MARPPSWHLRGKRRRWRR